MKKAFLIVALFSVVAAVLFAGCGKSDAPAPETPAAPSTNAPAPAK